MFDGPQRGIRCAIAIRDAVQALGIEVRAGLHTGECEVRGDDIGGIGVHIGARVSALAGPNEVLVSSTLRDLVIGSGLAFEDRGSCGINLRSMERLIVGLATTVLVSGGLGLAGLGLGVPTAQAG
jgi:class 3 adenylate cyclase